MRRILKKSLVIFTACVMLSMTACGKANTETGNTENSLTETKDTQKETETSESSTQVSSLNLWYTDTSIQVYLEQAVEAFAQENNVTVNLVKMSNIDYLDMINQNNIENIEKADVYILNSEFLEQAYLAGLALELPEGAYSEASYPHPAIKSTVYQEKTLAYPFYFETEFFLYNKNFAETAPASFQDIINFSETYQGDYEGIESILKWDVYNLFYSYGFVGAYLNLGGSYGDERTIIDLNNQTVIDALTFFKQLNQSLYFDASEVQYDTMLSEFLEGKILYTIAGTQSLPILAASDFNYGIAPLPVLNETLETRGIANNYVAVVNPYGDFTDMSQKLSNYITDTYADYFYELSGKLPCKRQDSSIYANPEFSYIMEAYEKSVQLPKLMDATNFWVETEVVLNNIWKTEMREEEAEENLSDDSQAIDDGTDEMKKQRVEEQIKKLVTEQINQLQEQMETQLAD